MGIFLEFCLILSSMREYKGVDWDLHFNCMKRTDKYLIFWVLNIVNFALSLGKFLNDGKCAGVKFLTNIMSALEKFNYWQISYF